MLPAWLDLDPIPSLASDLVDRAMTAGRRQKRRGMRQDASHFIPVRLYHAGGVLLEQCASLFSGWRPSRRRYPWARVIASEVRESLGIYQVRAEIIAPRAFRSNGKRRTNKNLTRSRRAEVRYEQETLTATQWKEELGAGDRPGNIYHLYKNRTNIEE